jgi:hypothetical protein
MKSLQLSFVMLMLFCAVPALAQDDSHGSLELRAQNALNAGQYKQALPLFRTLAERLKDEPDRIGQIQEKIRVCEANIKLAAEGAAPSDGVGAERKPHPEPEPGQTLEITIQDLGNFHYDAEQGGDIPEDVKRLSGTVIRTKGFMIPMDQAQNITQFAMVPDLFACCFGQPPQLQHTIIVNCPPGKAVAYFPDEIIVEGTLKVEVKKDEGYIVSIFEMTCNSVKPAAK